MAVVEPDDCPEQNRKILCLAWRLLCKHGDQVDQEIEAEWEQCVANRDAAGAAHWRLVAEAVATLRE